MGRIFTRYTNAIQGVVLVKRKKLLLFITCFIISSNYRSLFADSSEPNHANLINPNTDLNLIDHNVIELADNICNYILQGHSANEVIEMLNDDQTHSCNINIEKLVTHIESLLNKKYSTDNVINILAGNKEFEKFYMQKNFWAKIKNTYFVLESTAILVIIAVVFYLLYLLAKWLNFKIPWFKYETQRADDKIPKSGNIELDNHLCNHDKTSQTPMGKKEQSRCLDVQHIQQSQNGDTPTQPAQGAPKLSQNEQSFDASQYPNCDDEIDDIDKLDLELSHSITKQIEQARRVGLETDVMQFGTAQDIQQPRKDIPLGGIGERLLQQVEYARSIGLIPE